MRIRGHAAFTALAMSSALAVAACGGGSSSPGEAAVTTLDAPTSEAPTSDEIATTNVATTEPGVERGDAVWDGGDFAALADARMDELAATFDQPATPATVAGLFDLPDDFPYPDGSVIGIIHEFDRDLRFDDEIRIDEQRIVGVDGPGDAGSLDALTETVRSGTVSRWQGTSSQRDALNNDLYTAPAADGSEAKDRLVIRGNPEPETGESYLRFSFEQRPAEIPVPIWQAGLPILDGGELTAVTEGRGIVEEFGRKAENGHIESRHFYPIDRFAELEEFFASGVLESAGFTYEDTPFSTFDIRIDVSNRDWEGIVGVGAVNVDGEDIGYSLLWSLTRPGLVDAPAPAATPAVDATPATPAVERPVIVSGVDSSSDSPAPLAAANFAWNERNVQWDITLHGLVETTPSRSGDTGKCVHLVGVATPTFVSNGFATGTTDLPDFGVLSGGQFIADGNDCATEDLDAAGYGLSDVDGVIVGAPLNVAASFFVEGEAPAPIDAVVIGDEEDDDASSYFTPDRIESIPPRREPADDLAKPASVPLGGAITDIGTGGNTWSTTFHGAVVLPASDFLNRKYAGGTCIAIIGESTPIRIANGYITDDTPDMSLIAGGKLIGDTGLCETDELRASDYQTHNRRGYTEGTPMSFERSFFVPPVLVEQLTTLVVDGDDDSPQFFDMEFIDAVPPTAVPLEAPTLPESAGAMNAGAVSWTNQRGDVVEWSVEMAGLVTIGPSSDGRSTCYAVMGTITPAADVDSSFRIPDFSLIASGVEFREARSQCDITSLEAQGYAPSDDAQVDAGTEFAFFEAIPVTDDPARELDRVVVGNASEDLQSQAYDVALIETAPAP